MFTAKVASPKVRPVISPTVKGTVLIGVVPAGSPTPFGVTLSEAIGFALPLEGLKADVMFTPTALLIPPDPLRAILVPIVWVGALFALARSAMARRTV